MREAKPNEKQAAFEGKLSEKCLPKLHHSENQNLHLKSAYLTTASYVPRALQVTVKINDNAVITLEYGSSMCGL